MNPNKKIASGTYRGFWKNASSPTQFIAAPHICLHVDTSDGGFVCTPSYFITLYGNNGYWMINSSEAVFNPTKNGFDVYLRLPEGFSVDDISTRKCTTLAELANKEEWGVYWYAVEYSYRAPMVAEVMQAGS